MNRKLAAAFGLAALSAAAQPSPPLPPAERQGGIEWRSGGIGVEESRALDAEGRNWPLTLIFAIHEGKQSNYAAGVAYVIRDEKGAAILQGTAAGPYLLARLAPGRYTLEATLSGVPGKHAFTIEAGKPYRHTFLWSAAANPVLRDNR